MKYDPANDLDEEDAPGENVSKQTRYGFPMDFEAYSYDAALPAEGEHDAIVLFAKEVPLKGQEELENPKTKALVGLGLDGPEGRVRIDYHAAAGSGFLNQFVTCVLPEFAKRGADIKLRKARGRLARVVVVHDEWDGKIRAKVRKFLPEVSKKRLAMGVQGAGDAAPATPSRQTQASAPAAANNPFAKKSAVAQHMELDDESMPF